MWRTKRVLPQPVGPLRSSGRRRRKADSNTRSSSPCARYSGTSRARGSRISVDMLRLLYLLLRQRLREQRTLSPAYPLLFAALVTLAAAMFLSLADRAAPRPAPGPA